MKLSDTEIKFMNIVWSYEPIYSNKIVEICSERFGWKKSTTYTFLKRLNDKGVVVNNNSLIESLVKREEIQKIESENLIENTFQGSFLSFMVSFFDGKKLDDEEIERLKKVLDSYKVE